MLEIPLSHVGEEVQARIETCIKENVPVLLTGGTGIGKTFFLSRLARGRNIGLQKINQVGATPDMVWGMLVMEDGRTRWQDGLLTNAVRHGGWASVEELARLDPEIQGRFFSLLDADEPVLSLVEIGENLKPHPAFRFFATTNEGGAYFVRGIDKALRDRFFVQEWGLDLWNFSSLKELIGSDSCEKIMQLLKSGAVTFRKVALCLRFMERGYTPKDAWTIGGIGPAMEA